MGQNAEWIKGAERLEALAAQLLKADAVAVDTEFFWERTFYPVLGLIQLATCDGCWLVDTVALRDLRALGPVLAEPAVTKVLHDAPQDLGILARATGGLPKNVFDTRLAAGFAGLTSTLSLQALLRETLGVELAKSETRSDWLRRPLSAQQLTYAADDVLHLIALRDTLLNRCADDTARGWLTEELNRLENPDLYRDRDPRQMFLRVKGASRLNPRQRAILRELAAWREEEARRRDWPRAHVLPDAVLTAIAQSAPTDRPALADIPEFPRKMPDDVTARMLAAVTAGRAVPERDCPPTSGTDLATKRALKEPSDRLLAHIRTACEKHGVDPALVASRSDAEDYVQRLRDGTSADLPLASGWRAALVSGFTRCPL